MEKPKSFARVFQDVTVWTDQEVLEHQDLLINDQGLLSEWKPRGQLTQNISGLEIHQGGVLMPSGVDPQVHLRVPGQVEKETAESGLTAALRGGVGALLTMPNTRPFLDCVSALDLGRKESANAEKNLGVKILWSAAMTCSEQGQEIVDFPLLAKWGVRAFTDDGVGVASDSLMDRCFEQAAIVGLPVLQHAEVPGHRGLLAPSKVQQSLGIHPYPENVEVDMVRRDLKLLKNHPKAHYHLLHVSSAKSLDLIEQARKDGLKVSCEVTPHHLFFCGDDINPEDASFKMNPPLRSSADREILQKALQDGRINFMATDHAPHEPLKKGRDFQGAAFGCTGLETSLRVLLSLWSQGQLSAPRLVQVWSTEPAKFLKIDNEFGSLKVGRGMRAIWVDDLKTETAVGSKDLFSQSKNNCFVGARLPGRIRAHFTSSGFFHFD